MQRRTLLALGLAGGAALAGGAGVWRAFEGDLEAARQRLRCRSSVADTRFGPIEYATAGDGPPLLMIHGTGGGFDQGLAFAAPLIAAGYRVIAPSRFGYLRSAFPTEPTSDHQADAFVDLLDHLSVEALPVIGGSAGSLSALAFAVRYPRRCSALLPIVPATYVPNRPPAALSPVARFIMEEGLQSDFLFWLGLKGAHDQMIRTLLATDPALVKAASADERSRVEAILRDIFPVSDRARGLRNDARLAGDPEPVALDRIEAPTLAISLEDDGFGTLSAARHIARNVRGARLISYPTGGHIWVGRNAEIFSTVDMFLKEARSA